MPPAGLWGDKWRKFSLVLHQVLTSWVSEEGHSGPFNRAFAVRGAWFYLQECLSLCGDKACVGSFSALGNLGGKKEGCLLLKGGPRVWGGHFTTGYLQTAISPPPGKELYDIHLSGVCGSELPGTFIWIHLS